MRKRSKSSPAKKSSWMRKLLKLFILLVIIICLLFGAASVYIYYKGNDLLKEFLVTTVNKSSKGIYKLELEKLNINLFTGRINLAGFHLVPDTALYNERDKTDTLSPMLIDAKIDKFQVRGVDIKDILLNRKVDINKILISSPELTIILKKPSKKAEKQASNPKMLSIPLPKGLESLQIRLIQLDNGKLTIDDQTKQPAEKFTVPVINISFTNLLVDATHTGLKRILNTDDIRIALKGIVLKTKNGMYTITPGEIILSTGEASLTVNNLTIKPNYSNYEFSRKLGYQMDRMDISVKNISLQQLDLRQLIVNRKFIAGNILADGLVLEDYRDKRIPMRPDFKPPLPQQGLLNSKMYINIDNVKLTNGKVTYSEQVGDEPGYIFFDKMEGSIQNITNDSVLVSRRTVMKVNASMYLMGKGLLNAELKIPLGEKNDAFSFSGTLAEMDMKLINTMVTKMIPAEITSGTIKKMVFTDVKADNVKSTGRLALYYKDLTIKMIKTEEDNTWKKVKKGVLTFAGNTYVRNENPHENGTFNEGMIYFERDTHKSIFNFLWKSIFSGIKSTIGVNKEEQKEMKKAAKKK